MPTQIKPIELVKDSLFAAYRRVRDIGEAAKVIYGEQKDITTRGDIEAGQAIIDTVEKSGLPIVVYSEEFGRKEIGLSPKDSVVFDDIDGTTNYRKGRGMLPHGSIVGIFRSPDPKFNECLASGYLDFVSGNLIIAEKNKGTYLIEGWARGGKEEKKIRTSGRKSLSEETPLMLIPDLYMLGSLAPVFAQWSDRAWLGDFRCYALHMALIACGSADILVNADNCHIPTKRNTGEEMGPGYLLVTEAGGWMGDWNGKDLGPEKISFDKKKTFHGIVTATEELGKEFVEEMHKIPQIREYMKRKNL